MIQDLIGAPADRLASYRLIAEVCELRNALRQAVIAAGSKSGADGSAR